MNVTSADPLFVEEGQKNSKKPVSSSLAPRPGSPVSNYLSDSRCGNAHVVDRDVVDTST
jgi:hypothetical protein